MVGKKSINLEVFLNLYEKFINIPSWTKDKHKKFDEVKQYLNKYKVVVIRVKPHSKYNHCKGNHSFTIINVPYNQLGKLYQFRNKWVLIRCDSYVDGGWSQYYNEVYQLDRPFDLSKTSSIEKRFEYSFIV